MRLVLFNRDLRAIDNTALIEAIDGTTPVIGCYIVTPKQWEQHDLSPMQADLIYRRLGELESELSDINVPLIYGCSDNFSSANDWLISYCLKQSVTDIYLNSDYEFNEVQRATSLSQAASTHNISVHTFSDKCMLAPGTVLNKQGGYFKVFTPFRKAWQNQFSYAEVRKPKVSVEVFLPQEVSATLDDVFDYPRQDSSQWLVSTKDILARLRQFSDESARYYNTERDIPSIDGTSQLSPYLAIGALSVRQCIARLYYDSGNEALSEGAQVWLSELIWREFYQHLTHFEPKLSKHHGYLDWERALRWPGKDSWFERWCEGKTGYPIVDAAMQQLNQTGWMHNRLRMIVASFLTKDLNIDWRRGERYFMSKLVDGDFAANNGGWQWCASTGCDGQPYFRIFNPITQGERFDSQGEFIRTWLPELRGVPNKFIHKPWTWSEFASLAYPEPIVDHKTQREITLALYKEAKDQF
ncbi:deoxyribodipyrimidine photo-lyase [Vibrio maritimus]|uniref:deoxyribodipyrimidine photo-lyase n=1 Tax=Vibrio maritimus TaxID=990268 RepID=UPI0037350581